MVVSTKFLLLHLQRLSRLPLKLKPYIKAIALKSFKNNIHVNKFYKYIWKNKWKRNLPESLEIKETKLMKSKL